MFRTTYELTSRAPVQSVDPSYEPNEVYGCDLCSEGGWCSETEVEIHRKAKHTKSLNALIRDDTKHPCKICVTPHPNGEELIKHIKTVHLLSSEEAYRVEREIFTCNYCSQIFFNKQQLAVHIVYTHIDKERGVANCPRCLKNVRVKSMWFHYERHNIQSVSSCKICLEKCKNRKHLKEHIRTHLPFYKCEMCGYMAKKLALFKQHILTLHKSDVKETKEGKYKKYFIPQADHWNRKTQSTSALKGLHLHDFVRICILCREICTSLADMKHHILVEHTKFKVPKNVYICICGESFTNKVLFKHHTFKLKGGDHVLLVQQDG